MSYSSWISPTICSRMSSSVTMPAVPPNSSTTTAEMAGPALEVAQLAVERLAFGHEGRRPDQRVPGPRVVLPDRPECPWRRCTPITASGCTVVDQQPGVLRASERLDDLVRARPTSRPRRYRSAASSPRPPWCRRGRRPRAACRAGPSPDCRLVLVGARARARASAQAASRSKRTERHQRGGLPPGAPAR